MRLDKFLANNSLYSRKEIHNFINKAKVAVNGKIVKDKTFKVNENVDVVTLNNEVLKPIGNLYIAMNKPKRYLCTNSFSEQYPSILELLPIEYDKYDLHIVGRLDVDTSGLIFLTNDGQFSHKIKSPKYNIEKEYEVMLEKPFTTSDYQKLLKQKILINNKQINDFKISNINDKKLNITLTDGKHHEVKVIFKYANNNVVDLKRIRIANIKLEDLNIKTGEFIEFDNNLIIY